MNNPEEPRQGELEEEKRNFKNFLSSVDAHFGSLRYFAEKKASKRGFIYEEEKKQLDEIIEKIDSEMSVFVANNKELILKSNYVKEYVLKRREDSIRVKSGFGKLEVRTGSELITAPIQDPEPEDEMEVVEGVVLEEDEKEVGVPPKEAHVVWADKFRRNRAELAGKIKTAKDIGEIEELVLEVDALEEILHDIIPKFLGKGLEGLMVAIGGLRSLLEINRKRVEKEEKELDSAKLKDWISNLDDPTKYPQVVLLKDELAKALPSSPRAPNVLKNRIDALMGVGRAVGLFGKAKNELSTKGYADGDIGEKQKAYVNKEYFEKTETVIASLEVLYKEDKESKEVAAWDIDVKSFSDTIQEILGLPANIDTEAEQTRLLDLEAKLTVLYEALLADGSLDTKTENGDLLREIIDLVGKDKKSGEYIVAREKIKKLTESIHLEKDHPKNLSWEELITTIGENNIDVYDHAGMANPAANKYKVQVYNTFHDRKGALVKEDFPGISNEDFIKKDQERIDAVAWIVLSKIESINQNEGQVPTCTRPDLFPMLQARHMQRDIILKAITYHPEHGALMREILDDLIETVADNSSEINYGELTKSDGRGKIRRYIQKNFKARAESTLYLDLSAAERKKKIDRFFSLVNVTYNLFDLLTVSFAELQTQTKTGAHQKMKGEQSLETKNYVAITRPDAAWVHNTQRYDSPTHVSALFSFFMSYIPAKFGRKGNNNEGKSYHEMLRHQQHELIEFQDSFFDVSSITGANGIEPTSIFNPLYPDTRSFLLLADKLWGKTEMLEFGDDVYGLDSSGEYVKLGKKGDKFTAASGEEEDLEENFAITAWYEGVGMTGWEKILNLALGDLPPEINQHMILKSSDTGGDDPNLGLVDIMINSGCGMAKMFPGRHMEAVTQLFTHYLMRIFSRHEASLEARQFTFTSVVSKLQNAAATKGGLGGYQNVAAQIIRNISGSKYDGWSNKRVLETPAKKFKMGNVLQDGLYKRRKQRIKYLRAHYKEHGLKAPFTKIPIVGRFFSGLRKRFAKFSQTEKVNFWKIIDGEESLPSTGINTKQSLFKIIDKDH